MLRAACEAWDASLAGVRDIRGLTWSLSLEPLPPAIYQRDVAANVLGLADRTGSRVVCLLTQTWADQADNERVYAASAALIATIEDAARSLDAYDPYIYLDYAAPWQDPIASYGTASVQQLQKLRARVDPKGVFTHLVPGGFKIPS
jgi:LmbE family N-acetylglucosaminyl deacetylase